MVVMLRKQTEVIVLKVGFVEDMGRVELHLQKVLGLHRLLFLLDFGNFGNFGDFALEYHRRDGLRTENAFPSLFWLGTVRILLLRS